MRTYHWKEYGFIGTVPDFARHFGICKSPTFVNAVRRVSRHVYNCMNAREQAEYEEKRERVKPAYRLYLDEERTRFIEMTKEEYEAVGLPVVQEEVGMFKLSYRNRSLPASFVGNGRDESPVASAMKKYRAEAMRFAGQVMLATGYFNTRLPTEQPKTEINYTELRLSYSNGIVFYFVADRSRDGVCAPTVRARLGTFSGSLSKKRELAILVSVVSVFTRVREVREENGSLKAIWPSGPIPPIKRSMPPASSIICS